MSAHDHCLRPDFTRIILKALMRGTSCNLIGRDYDGTSRLLLDIKSCTHSSIKTIIINMRTCRNNYAALMRDISNKFGDGTITLASLDELNRIAKARSSKVFLMLDHFDSLLDNPDVDSRFDNTFYDNLNSIKNTPKISLLCVTNKPHDQSVIFVDNRSYTSWLDLQQFYIPALSYYEIAKEVERRTLPISEAEKLELINYIHQFRNQYYFLDFASEQLCQYENNDSDLHSRLKNWEKLYKKRRLTFSTYRFSKIRSRVRMWFVLTGINHAKNYISRILPLFKVLLSKFK